MGRAADPWRAAETWIRCLASHSVPLHATAGLSAHPNLAHLPAEPGICNRHDRSWCIPCGFIERSLTLHPVPPYRSSNLTDWRDPHNGSTPVPPPPTALGDRTHWTMAGRRLSPYRSRASPRRKPPAFKNFARPTAIARMRQASRVLWGDILHVCHERHAQKPMILNAPTLPRGPSMSRLSRTRF